MPTNTMTPEQAGALRAEIEKDMKALRQKLAQLEAGAVLYVGTAPSVERMVARRADAPSIEYAKTDC